MSTLLRSSFRVQVYEYKIITVIKCFGKLECLKLEFTALNLQPTTHEDLHLRLNL